MNNKEKYYLKHKEYHNNKNKKKDKITYSQKRYIFALYNSLTPNFKKQFKKEIKNINYMSKKQAANLINKLK